MRSLMILLICCLGWGVYAQKDCFALQITPSEKDNSVLQLTVINTADSPIEIAEFPSNRNAIVITDEHDVQISFNFIHCGVDYKTHTLAASQNYSWEYDLDRFFNTEFTRTYLQKGIYKVYWFVHGVESKPFLYEYE